MPRVHRCRWLYWQIALWVLAFSVNPPVLSASNHRFLVRNWTPDEGLPQNVVFTVTQTRDGYLWLGTGNGLARFDGVHFKTYDEEEAPDIAGSKILKLFEDSQLHLWIVTDNAGVLTIDPGGKVTPVHKTQPDEGPVVSICEDPNHNIWFLMSKGQLYHFANHTASLILKNCHGLTADNTGILWVGAAEGKLLGLGPISTAGITAIPVSYELPTGKLDYLVASKHGGVWRCADGKVQKWQKDRLEQDFGPYPWKPGLPILAACEDNEGGLIVGTIGQGAFWFNKDGTVDRIQGLSQENVLSLEFDNQGSLWVGMNGGGLDRVRPQKFEVLEGTLDTTVQSVCPDRQGGVWIGFNGDRVDHWTGGKLVHYDNLWPAAVQVPGLTPIYIQSVFEDRLGQVWAGGSSLISTQLCFLVLVDGRFLPVQAPPILKQTVTATFQTSKGALLIGTEGGVGALEGPGRWNILNTAQGLSSDTVRAFAEDRAGNIWVGTERGGLNQLQSSNITVFKKSADGLPADNITCLYTDSEGVLWVGSSGGLARYDKGNWRRYTIREGLSSNRITYIIEDSEGFFWLGSNLGIMRIPKRALNAPRERPTDLLPCRLYGKADGLPTGECSAGSQPAAARTADGKLWFPTIKGLVVVQPSALAANTNPPPVVIEAVYIDGTLQGTDRLRTEVPKAITVPASKRSLEVHFASLNLAAPDNGQFRYRLTPHERDWTRAEAQRRYARYSRVPAGNYKFEITACNEDGVWNEQPAVLNVQVLPPVWQTWWFISISTLLLLGGVAGSVHYVSTQKLQRQLAALRQQEALERERSRIARDLHDQLGANLTQVALLGELAEADKELPQEVEAHARQICQTARETTHALDEIVWTVNPSNDTLDGLVNYVCKYAQDYLAIAELKYRIEVPPQLPAVPITPELRHNVFLAAKEAINNVVKHAHATSAWVRLELNTDQFVLEIEDNGRGIQKGDESKGRSGLKNMQKRMEEIGGRFEATAGAAGGTRIRLTAPIHPNRCADVDAAKASH